MLNEIYRIEEVVQEFIEFSKSQPNQKKKTNIKLVLQQVFKLFSSQTRKQAITIMEDHNVQSANIYCDRNQIKQVFMHILQNAIDAMPHGGHIKVQLLSNGEDFLKIRFIDNGYGMTEERIKHIGEPYYCIKEKGTGFGLMVSYKIVQEHGGTIHISSKLNEGTTVDVILPMGNIE